MTSQKVTCNLSHDSLCFIFVESVDPLAPLHVGAVAVTQLTSAAESFRAQRQSILVRNGKTQSVRVRQASKQDIAGHRTAYQKASM